MAQLKSGDIDRFLRAPAGYTAYLVYGPDHGLAAERARTIAEGSGIALDDAFSTIKLDQAALSVDPDRLVNEAYTVGMFGGQRLIWLRGIGNDRTVSAQLERILADPPPDAIVLIEAGELKKGAALRTAIEKATTGIAIPCYPDSVRSIQALLDDIFEASGQRLELDARQYLLAHLGGDRAATRAELEKLLLYTRGQDRVTLADARAICGDASALGYDDVGDAVLSGDLEAFDRAMIKFESGGGAPSMLFGALIRQFQTLDRLRDDMDRGGRTAAAAVAAARPPVFFGRRRLIEDALRRWPSPALRAALARLQDALLQSRQRRAVERNILHITLMALTIQSARRGQTR